MANYLDRSSPDIDSKADLYSPLKFERDQVRFIEILPSDTNDEPVRCLLKTTELTRDIRYAALSYVWGDREDTRDIIVDGVEFPVTNNLESALRYLRKDGFPKHDGTDDCRLLWVDAVCINQADNSERNHQLVLMSSIYRNATSVFSWLGPPKDRIDHALQLIHDFVEEMVTVPDTMDCSASREDMTQTNMEWPVFPEFDLDLNSSKLFSDWMSVPKFGSCKYWTRMWIIQELALAKSPKDLWIICGSKFLSYEKLKAFFSFFHSVTWKHPPETTQHDHTKLTKKQWLAMANPAILRRIIVDRLLSFVEHLKDDIQNDSIVPHTTLWKHVISASLIASATDPRDMVYAVLGLVPNNMIPDYNKSVRQIYLDAVLHDGISKAVNISLQFSGRGYNIGNKNELPSWLPDLPNLKSDWDTYFWDFRTDIGPLLKDIKLREPELASQNVLNVQGIVCGHVASCLRLIGSKKPPSDLEESRKLYQLCADYLINFRMPPKNPFDTSESGHRPLLALMIVLNWKIEKFGQAYNKDIMKVSRPINATRLPNISDLDLPYHGYWIIEKVLGHILLNLSEEQRMIQARRFGLVSGSLFEFVLRSFDGTQRHFTNEMARSTPASSSTSMFIDLLLDCIYRGSMSIFQTDQGYIGIGPEGLQPGDLVCAVDKCSLPVLLRKEAENEDSPFVHVGCCYVLGLSGGEPAEMVRTGELKIKTFKIR
ncbi:heterokaryon incompatibility protein-domain-containing protein [Annulohypoxylon nitens]|nr:heterokaryon incompatibility protein-domain-containing protein [Annulohypoxylon nitens]